MRVIDNPYQGKYPRVLFVCSGGILRSATAAHLFANPEYKWNTRAVGTEPEALQQVTEELLSWADVIFCMERYHAETIIARFGGRLAWLAGCVHVLNIPDTFVYRDPALEELLVSALREQEDDLPPVLFGSDPPS